MDIYSRSSIENIKNSRAWIWKNKCIINPHMHEIFLQRYCMKWVPGDTPKEMIN